jgi:glycine cleavage system H protein
MTLEQLLYAKTHEWVDVQTDPSGAKIATVGISAFALEALTDLVYIELPEVGRQVKAGESFGVIESVKAVSDLVCPVDGEIVEVNTRLLRGRGIKPGKYEPPDFDFLAKDPYESGWFVKIRISDETGLSALLDYGAYQKQCEEERADE